jgi:hypothetical protein
MARVENARRFASALRHPDRLYTGYSALKMRSRRTHATFPGRVSLHQIQSSVAAIKALPLPFRRRNF